MMENKLPHAGVQKDAVAVLLLLLMAIAALPLRSQSWIRINQLGYPTGGVKVAVFVSKDSALPATFSLKKAEGDSIVFSGSSGYSFGAYGPFSASARLSFTSFVAQGRYYLQCGDARSPIFAINDHVYDGAADFCLQYLRQQRSGFNPFLHDSCHTGDGYTMYGPMPDTTRINVSGGWHDATDYLQYVTTSANATYHLLAAYRDFPEAFTDGYTANGLPGANKIPDVMDEARWGLDWLLKMHPRKDWMFNQLADDRDHAGFRLPNKDSVDYGVGKGKGRPVYFATGEPQGLGKYKNRSTGIASAAGKFSSAFALAAGVYKSIDPKMAELFASKALSAYALGLAKPGVSQTAPNREPYFYEEDNWTDDMELAAANLYRLTGNKSYLTQGLSYADMEKVTPWMGADTAKHYQWYPFHNFGHYELAASADRERALLAGYYQQGIDKVWQKAKQNAFFRGVPFIWCSNNLEVAFTIQCALYRRLTTDTKYEELEQAGFDWLMGCNPWGKSMVYGLPAEGNTPHHPHSSLSYLNHYDLNGAMVDGPVYGSIYKNLRGLKLFAPDENEAFQSSLVVYHDDTGDYSTNEPTTDGTATLIYLLASQAHLAKAGSSKQNLQEEHGAIIRGPQGAKRIALVFTGDEFADGGSFIARELKKAKQPASFFLTGKFYRNRQFLPLITQLQTDRHYLGVHSDQHLLYCDWNKRDSLLISKQQFRSDLEAACGAINNATGKSSRPVYFLPPYEWYNDSIAAWTRQMDMQLVCYTPGTRSNADYTYPQMGNRYVSSQEIYQSILEHESHDSNGLSGFILLLHIGTDPRRTDKMYKLLPRLLQQLSSKGYEFVRIDQLLESKTVK